MAGFARPELIATPDWLAENLGRPDLRVIDVRWRPDGSSTTLYGTGHIPGAVHLDWRASVVDAADTGDDCIVNHCPLRVRREAGIISWRCIPARRGSLQRRAVLRGYQACSNLDPERSFQPKITTLLTHSP